MTNEDKIKSINWTRLLILSVVTFGVYLVYWFVLLKRMLVEKGEVDLPTSWLIIVPLANLFLVWKVLQSIEKLSKGKLSSLTLMLISVIFAPAGVVIVHDWVIGQK